MNNTKQIIDSHNKRILKSSQCTDLTKTTPKTTKNCNCRQKNACPLNGNCLQTSVIYQASVTRKDNNTTETYIGLTENEFKVRYSSLRNSIRDTAAGKCRRSGRVRRQTTAFHKSMYRKVRKLNPTHGKEMFLFSLN